MKRFTSNHRLLQKSFKSTRIPSATLNRGGTTLSAILISLMVMSIGVVSLATLFPISVLRSIQATQLTNASIHRLNAKQVCYSFPQLILNPDADTLSGGTNPNYLLEHQLFNVRDLDHNTVDNPYDEGSRFIVDPLGWNEQQFKVALSGSRMLCDEFGNRDLASIDPSGDTVLRRYHGGLSTLKDAKTWTYLPDSWQLQLSGTAPTPAVNNSITVPATVDTQTSQQTLADLGAGSVRIILFSANGKSSVVRNVTSIVGTSVSWDDTQTTADDLPSAGYGTTLQRYRVEVADPRYSWLLSVRRLAIDANGNGSALADVVVFHKRSLSAAVEQIYSTTLTKGNNSCTITVSGTAKPFLKKGGFIFDAQGANWYRIVKIDEATNPIVYIDRPAVANTNRIMAMPGIVEVYPVTLNGLDGSSL